MKKKTKNKIKKKPVEIVKAKPVKVVAATVSKIEPGSLELKNRRRETFCTLYAISCNATKAYIGAEFSPQGAAQSSCRLLTIANVAERIKYLRKERILRIGIEGDDIYRAMKNISLTSIHEMIEVVDVPIKKTYSTGGVDVVEETTVQRTMVRKDIPERVWDCVKEITVDERKIKVGMYDKKAALELLGLSKKVFEGDVDGAIRKLLESKEEMARRLIPGYIERQNKITG